MNLNILRGKSVWITGASSGIGRELALLAAEAGASLLLVSSRKEVLADTARLCSAKGACSVNYHPMDLSETDRIADAAATLLEAHGVPDYLILNAGISHRSLAGETDLAVTKKVMDINFFGAVAVSRIVLPAMVRTGGGHIAVTSSMVGEFGFPLRSAYSASKKALIGYYETVDLEYSGQGIRTTLALPGRIRTDISTRALLGDGRHHHRMDPGLEKGLDARICARRYWKAVIRGRHTVIIGGYEVLMIFFHRFLPGIFRVIAKKTSPY